MFFRREKGCGNLCAGMDLPAGGGGGPPSGAAADPWGCLVGKLELGLGIYTKRAD